MLRLHARVRFEGRKIAELDRSDNEVAGINYCLCRLAFGDLSFEESKRSVELFAKEVMPAL